MRLAKNYITSHVSFSKSGLLHVGVYGAGAPRKASTMPLSCQSDYSTSVNTVCVEKDGKKYILDTGTTLSYDLSAYGAKYADMYLVGYQAMDYLSVDWDQKLVKHNMDLSAIDFQ